MRFLNHTQRPTTVGRTPLDERSAARRDLYIKTHNTDNRQTSMPQAVFEPTISAGERQQNYALDRAATGSGCLRYMIVTRSVAFDVGLNKYLNNDNRIRECHITHGGVTV